MSFRLGTPVIVGSGSSAKAGYIAGDLDPANPGDGPLIAVATANAGTGIVTRTCSRMTSGWSELSVSGNVTLTMETET